MSAARAVEIGLGVLGALKAAHKAGVMHRDVKPGNVLLGDDGRVVLTDFGLATIPGDPNVTRTGMVLGSPAYIAPERARDGTAGPEADLWSLGATLYAAVEGKSPYARPSAIATLAALATEPLPPPKNAGPLKPVLNGLLRKDPDERITAEVAERLLRRAGRQAGHGHLAAGRRTPAGAERSARAAPAAGAGAAPGGGSHRPAGARRRLRGRRGGRRRAAAAAVPPRADAEPTANVPPARRRRRDRHDRPSTDLGRRADRDPRPSRRRTATPHRPTRSDDGRCADGRPVAPKPRRPTNPTSVMPAPVSPPRPSGRAPVLPVDGTKPSSTRRNVLIGALVALLLIGLVVVVPLLNRGDDDGDDARRPARPGPPRPRRRRRRPPRRPRRRLPAPPPARRPRPPPRSTRTRCPPGWKLHKDADRLHRAAAAGLELPPERRRQTRSSSTSPDGRGRVAHPVDQHAGATTRTRTGRARSRTAGSYVNNYQYIGIKRCDYWKTCADWEWLETRDGDPDPRPQPGLRHRQQPGLRHPLGDRREGLAGQPAELRPDRQGIRSPTGRTERRDSRRCETDSHGLPSSGVSDLRRRKEVRHGLPTQGCPAPAGTVDARRPRRRRPAAGQRGHSGAGRAAQRRGRRRRRGGRLAADAARTRSRPEGCSGDGAGGEPDGGPDALTAGTAWRQPDQLSTVR